MSVVAQLPADLGGAAGKVRRTLEYVSPSSLRDHQVAYIDTEGKSCRHYYYLS